MTSRQTVAVTTALSRLERWGTERAWLGSDPYEGLNATRAPLIRSTALGRRVLEQAVKRSPVDLRRPLGIQPEHNAVGVANLLSAYARGSFDDGAAKLARQLEVLESLRLTEFERPCWGYHFDVETRVFFYPRTRPNTIATAFAGQALLDAYEATGDERLLAQAHGVGEFFLQDVRAAETPSGAYFGYFVGDRSPIHNASMLVCGLLARLLSHGAGGKVRDACTRGVEYCLTHQRPDGSWPYGEQPGLQWVDGFHTGYVLEALLACERAGVGDVGPALERGLAFYRDRLFLADGTAKYYVDDVFPVDAQCVAQGIQTFALASLSGRDFQQPAWRVFDFAQRRMQRRDGAYVFQRRRLWVNRTPHIRWVQAPMMLALTRLRELTQAA